MVIGCDGVLADLRSAVAAAASEVTGFTYAASDLPADFALGCNESAWQLDQVGLSGADVGRVLGAIAARRGFVASLAPYPGARDGLRALRAAGAAVSCWAPTWRELASGEEERLSWLALHMGIDVVHLAHDPFAVDAAVFVDCSPTAARSWSRRHRGGEAVIWVRGGDLRGPVPYGCHVTSSWRAIAAIVADVGRRREDVS